MSRAARRPHGQRPKRPATVPPALPADVRPRVVVAESSIELAHWLASRRRHHRHVAWLRPPGADGLTLGRLAAELLVGLGKQPGLSSIKRPAEHVAAAWMLHDGTTDVLVAEAQRVPAWLLGDLVVWLCGLGVRPWVVYTAVDVDGVDTTAAIAELAGTFAGDWGTAVGDAAELTATFADIDAPAAEVVHGRPSGLVALPRCDGTVFRSTVAALLPPRQAKAVDARFVAEVARLRQVVADASAEPDRHKARPLARALRGVLEGARDTEEMILLARAAQVACLVPHKVLVRVDTVHLVGAAEARPRNGTSATSQMWQRLAAYRDPDYGAASALHASGFDVDDIASLTVGDVAQHPDGTVTVRDVAVVEGGSLFVAVLAGYQRLVGCDDGLLFTTHRAGRVRARFVHQLIGAPATETGAVVTATGSRRTQPTHAEWLARHGITFEHLGNTRAGRT